MTVYWLNLRAHGMQYMGAEQSLLPPLSQPLHTTTLVRIPRKGNKIGKHKRASTVAQPRFQLAGTLSQAQPYPTHLRFHPFSSDRLTCSSSTLFPCSIQYGEPERV